jgi:hypothetical protein
VQHTRRLLALAVLAVGAIVVVPAASAWTVTMTAQPSLKRTHHWTIEKSVSQPAVTLAQGATTDVTYSVTVRSTGSTDGDWGVSGNVSMTDDPNITVNTIRVLINPDDVLASMTCMPATFPVELGLMGLECAYSAPLADASGPRDAWMRAVQVNGNIRNVHTPFDFGSATVSQVDECVDVTDTMAGALGTVCVGDAPKTFTYTKTIGGFTACGEHEVDNTASFTTTDSGATGSAGASVDVTVTCAPPPPPPPPSGCTHTIGYWKTHAGFGPQADVVTPLLPLRLGTAGGAKTIEVTTASTAVSLLSMQGSNSVGAASNGINKLYAQLLGAKLSGASGSDTSSVAATIASADAFLATHDSLSWAGLTKAGQKSVLGWMTTLDDYNNGRLGAEHCD